ncbi:MAG: AAA family ATPase [Clostridia bacterium]|nr:AAA family ATPase [Clostridia bacterium]
MSKKIALLGRALKHSYSPVLHSLLGMDYSYTNVELEPEELGTFLENNDYDGFNVTIPYKKDVIPYLSGMSETAKRLGSVNTVIRTENGYFGDNTDYAGFSYMLDRAGCDIRGKKALILGNGGVCPTVRAVLEDRGAGEVVVISHKDNTDENLEKHRDTALLVNTTPVGMFPKNLNAPASLDHFPVLEGVLDLIYNPFETAIIREARLRGIPAVSGISMLTAQAKRGAELFTGLTLDDSLTARVTEQVVRDRRNIILIGMPGCGKSTLGRKLAQKMERTFVDLDAEITKRAGKPIPTVFAEDGEDAFRVLEHEVVCDFCKESGLVIATGGGVVTREGNCAPMQQNGIVVFVERAVEKLPSAGRPLSLARSPEVLYKERLPLYRAFADVSVSNEGNIEETLAALETIATQNEKFY